MHRDVRGRSLWMVHQIPGIGVDVQLHSEMKLVPLLRPVHLRIMGVVLVPGRRRRRDDGGVNNAALLQQDSLLGQVIPGLPNGRRASPRRSSRRRKSGSSSCPESSADSPRQGAGRSRPRKQFFHRRQRMQLSLLAVALRMRRRNVRASSRAKAVYPII